MAALNAARLQRLHLGMLRYVERGQIAGAALLVSRQGEIWIDTLGYQSLERHEPMRRDTLFRIASMTKAVTAAAAMMLVEEGRLGLDDPLDPILPELANRRVLRRIDGSLDDTEPAHRPLTLRDLLTFRLGFGNILASAESWPIQRAINAQQLVGRKPPTPHAPDEWLRRLGTLPLMYQPGERWMYHTGSEIAGVLIARVAGRPLEQVLRERIFEPLGMHDTGFHVPPEKLERLASCYQEQPLTQSISLFDDARDSQWSRSPVFPSGGGGLVSTLRDYHAFAQMLLGMGRLGSVRLLARPTVEAMVTDQLSARQKSLSTAFFPSFWEARGWGFGVAVITSRDGPAMDPGRFGWDGVYGTSWYSDPREDLTAILMIQRLSYAPTIVGLNADFWNLVYQAIED